jgi:hypothetical protein
MCRTAALVPLFCDDAARAGAFFAAGFGAAFFGRTTDATGGLDVRRFTAGPAGFFAGVLDRGFDAVRSPGYDTGIAISPPASGSSS